ncbi:5' nucleotidase, NT5C type [Teredinibacter purpureus]|uniref:5' nucleotidase, NT5C type n=1 Tax=Teredinibacter purpureus TaxID=2731756 RepID=UPI0005F7ED4C|nr:hypothetical protein [Teredinibacter purpureus]
MKQSIAIDMDETVADTLSRHLEWYCKEFGVSLNKKDMKGKRIYDVVSKENLDTVKNYPNHPDFFKDLPVFEDAVSVIQELSIKYDIYFVSAAMEYPNSFNAKYEWLKQHFSFISDMNYIFCGYKGMLNCDYLIDDSSRHIDAFNGDGYLFNAPHNSEQTNYKRINSWAEIGALFA